MKLGTGLHLILAVTVTVAVDQDVNVPTGIGNITGQVELFTFNGTSHSLVTFYGIPYAESPTGTRRFKKPVKKQPFTEAFRADTMPPMCYQNTQDLAWYGVDIDSLNISENCLALNIFVPGPRISASVPRAVMLWIYGGGFQTGSQDFYDARALPALNDVILVTINYRLSILGFLSTGARTDGDNSVLGNYGLWDQHMAIKWVHDHIDKFGGDPNRVTIFGESAGSASVIYQALYEGSQGLFQRVIAQSGSPASGWALDHNPRELFLRYANANGCSKQSNADTVNCLREIPADSLDLQKYFNPVVDGDFVKMKPLDVFLNETAEASNILKLFGQYDVLMGVNSAEGGSALIEIDYVANQRGEDISNGYSASFFETMGIDVVLKYANVASSPSIKAAIVHEYVDWSDPADGQSMISRTVDMGSDVMMNAGVIQTIKAHSKTVGDSNRYFYVFDFKPKITFHHDDRYPGANHGDEIVFVLGFPNGLMSLLMNGTLEDPATSMAQEYLILSKQLMTYWTNFAKCR